MLGQGGGSKSLITTPTRSQGLGECLGRSPSLVESQMEEILAEQPATWGRRGWKEEGGLS